MTATDAAPPATPAPGSTPRTRVRRLAEREVRDLEALHATLDAGYVAHVAVVDDGQPYVVPVAYVRDGDRVLFHGSTGSRLFRALAAGQRTCVTVTLLDGLVLARSAFESSMNYRSVMILGVCEVLEGDAKGALLELLTERLLPGRWPHLRPMSAKEQAGTLLLALPLDEASVKISTGGPADEEAEDVAWPVWAGHIPLHTVAGDPVPASDLAPGIAVPDHVLNLVQQHREPGRTSG